ncbi:GntR family transcriptional regulator [Arthrobacter castelli]|uniref:GntR family transcriptional regulator n=1 Tax=Arthrobacter castelli TaxID=271431 RepID=UPI000685D732|nr:GntR family transcriptional regulator [Arthrobacter castelli]
MVETEVAVARGDALVEQAYRVLRDEILGHQLLPGSRLSAPGVARRLNISRSPAREAIARIVSEGLAHSVPNRGAIVASIGADDLVHIYELREVLEGLAGRLAASRIDADRLVRLEEIWESHSAAVQAHDVDAHMALDADFHRSIREISGNARLMESLDRLQGEVRLAMATTHLFGGGMEEALAEHRLIIDSLRSGDPEAAEETARKHIERLRRSLEAAVAEEAQNVARQGRNS